MGGHRARRGPSSAYRLWLPREHGTRIAKRISRVEGESLVERGVATKVYDQTEHRYDFQLLGAKDAAIQNGAPVKPRPVALTARDAELVAGCYGRSRTAGMLEEYRLVRVDMNGVPQPAEDAVERAQEKLRLWPYTLPNNRKLLAAKKNAKARKLVQAS